MADSGPTLPACPSDEVLVAFVDGGLDRDGAAALEEHLDACATCGRIVAAYAAAYLSHGGDGTRTAPTAASVDPRQVQRLQAARALPPGARVGRYVLLDCLGEGASSIVYGAYDPELDRKVALKVLRASFGEAGSTRAILLREARAMARLAHQHIVVVHDVGADGERVFIAMELVDGPTLRGWLAEKERTTAEVLGMLLGAGRGIAAIHAAGLVHRDFKPENVLVGKDGRARVTDLGLARVLEGEGDGAPASERAQAIVGTPAYMAPEQREGRRADASSDQFAFAVTAYEALFGERPNQGEAPRLRSIAPRSNASSARRVSRRVRLALARALSTSPERRFPSMRELLRELEADGARVRRIALAITAIAAVAGIAVLASRLVTRPALCGGAASELDGSWNTPAKDAIAAAFRATGRPYAEAAVQGVVRGGDAYARAWTLARAETCEATRVRGTQSDAVMTVRMECLDRRRRELAAAVDVFTHADAEVVENAVAAVEHLAPIAACADVSALLAPTPLPDAPAVRAEVKTLRDEIDRVKILGLSGKPKAARPAAEAAARRAKALKYRPIEAEALFVRGGIERSDGDYPASVKTWLEAVSAAEAGRSDALAAEIWSKLVELQAELDRFDDAHAAAERSRAAIERNGGAGLAKVYLPEALGTLYRELGRYPEAAAQHREAIALEEVALGAEHLEVAASYRHLGNALRDDGEFDGATDAYRRSLALVEKLVGPDHPAAADAVHGLAVLENRRGHYDRAIPLYERALKIREAALGDRHPRVGETLGSLVVALRWSGRAAEALPLAERSLAIEEAAYGTKHDVTAAAQNNVAYIELALHRPDEARAGFEKVLAVREALLGPAHTKVAMSLENLGQVALAEKDFAKALGLYERAVTIDEKALKPGHRDLAYALVGIGQARLGLGDAKGALEPLERAMKLRDTRLVEPRLRGEAEFALARALRASSGDAVRVAGLARDALAHYDGPAFRDVILEVGAFLESGPAAPEEKK